MQTTSCAHGICDPQKELSEIHEVSVEVGTEKRTGAGVHGEPDEALAAAHKHALPAARRPQKHPGHALSQDKLSLSAAPRSLPE